MVGNSCIVDFPETQRKREEIDVMLVDLLKDFLSGKNVIESKEDLDKLIEYCNDFKSFLQDLSKEAEVDLSLPNGVQSSDYEERSEEAKKQIFFEKQKYAHKLLQQIFISIDPYKLSKGHTKYFSVLLKFQEMSPVYLSSYRDHLIHSLRVFLLVIAIFEALKGTWINILKGMLTDLLKKLDKNIEPTAQLKRLEPPELWAYSIRGATLMSLFHDIGIVYSKYKEMIDEFGKNIFGVSEDEDLSIFEWQPQLKRKYEHYKEKILPIFEELSEKYHPEYEKDNNKHKKLHKILEDDLEKIKTLENEDIHGTLSLFLIFQLYYNLESVLLGTTPPQLQKEYGEAGSRPEWGSGRTSTKDRIVADNEGEDSREKLKDVVDKLILYEAMNAIFAHDKKGHVALSPFSEILVFADNSQEWDRFECKEGKPIKFAKDKIGIYVDVNECEGGETALRFYEETSLQEASTLNKIISKLGDVLKDDRKRGVFGIFFYIKVDEKSPGMNPSRALFRCRYHPQIFDDRDLVTREEEIDIRDFCRKCEKKQKGG